MRKFLGFVLWSVCLLMAEGAHAATTLYLPRQFNASDLGTIGVALVNPTTTAASVTFRWRDGQGGTLATAQRAIPAKGQFSTTLAEVFSSVTEVGWLSADIDINSVTGFWLVGDFATSADGAALLSSSNAIASPTFTFFSSRSEVSFANLGSSTLTGNLVLYNAAGQNLGSVPFTLPSMGCYQNTVAGLFPAQAADFDSNGYWINVSTSSGQIIGTAVTPNPGGDNIVTNAAYESSNLFLFPQVVDGAIGGTTYDTILTLTNYQTSTQTATLTLRQPSGPTLTAQRTIPARGVVRSTVRSIFNVSSLDGWLLVGTGAGNIGGTITYTDLVSGGSAAVSMQRQAADTNLIFGHIADLNPWWTGIALVNYFTTTANVEVYAIDPAGALIGGPAQAPVAAFTLAPQTKRAFLLGDLVPRTQQRLVDGGFILVRSTNGVGLYGTELFFLRSGRVIASVPGTGLGTTTFTPPTNLSVNAVTISVAPATANVAAGTTQQFSATVTGSNNRAATWSVNDVLGGNGSVGTIDATGLYTAPGTVPASNTVTIKATSVADATKSATATAIITAAPLGPSTSRYVTITSNPPPAMTTGSATAFSFVGTGGTPPYTWESTIDAGVNSVVLLNGMSLNFNTGVLSGTPGYTGTWPLGVLLTDRNRFFGQMQYDLRFTGTGVSANLTNTPPAGTEGTPYSFTFGTNYTGSLCFPGIALLQGFFPPGLTANSFSRTLSGTPLVAGSYTFTLQGTGGGSSCSPTVERTNARTFTIQISPRAGSTAPRGSQNWVRPTSAPVLSPTAGAWDGWAIRSPSVVKVDGTYMMYYEGEDYATHTRQIGLATSTDGISWTKSPANPVLTLGASGRYDSVEVRYPSVHFDGTTYRMWYWGVDDRDYCIWIGLATSSDGVTWTRRTNALNLSSCDWGNAPGSVVKVGDTFMMWYWQSLFGSVSLATSTDGITWSDRGSVLSSSDVKITNPSVVLDGSTYRMWYNRATGGTNGLLAGPGLARGSIGYATSANGTTWTLLRDADSFPTSAFVQGGDGAWDRPGIGQPAVILDGPTFKMWYTGGPINLPSPGAWHFVEGSVGYATSTP